MGNVLQDLQFGNRLLWKDKGFTLTTLLTLAVCIGANAAIFSVVHSVLLRPLPFPESDRVVLAYDSYPRAGVIRGDSGVPDYYDRLRDVTAFEQIALYQGRGLTLGGEGSASRIQATAVTPSFFPLLRARALRGRVFRPEEGEIGGEHKVILSYASWQRLFAGSDTAVGKDLRINGVPYSIVGVMPADFLFLRADTQLWIPLAFTVKQKADESRHSNNWSMIGRLKLGATVRQAQQQIDALNARNLERFPAMRQALIDAGFHTVAVPLQEDLVRTLRPVLYLLWGGVVCVLLIGCVNITNLALVRSSGRIKELATRQSLGASHLRIARQLLIESMLLTVAGGLGGVLLGRWLLGFLSHLDMDDLPRGSEIHMDAVVVAAMLGLAALIGLVVGIVPVVTLLRANLNALLRNEGRGGTSGHGTRRARRALVTAQFAFAFILLVCAGLLAVSFRQVLAVHPGFEPDGVLTAMISLPAAHYKTDAELQAFAARALEATRRLPGVQSAGITTAIPFGGNYSDSVIFPEGYVIGKGDSVISPSQLAVSEGYLETMHTRLVRGRLFNAGDTAQAPKRVIVDARLAQRFWPNLDPIGRRMYQPEDAQHLTPGPKTQYLTVVGVVDDVKLTGLVEADGRFGAYYFPYAQSPDHGFALAVLSTRDPLLLSAAIRRVVAGIDPELPVFSVKTMNERMQEALVSRRVPMLLALGFAAVALFLSAVGVYGVLAYQVAQRTREIGIRMALGGTARAIARLVLAESARMLALGLGIGMVGTLVASRAMRNLFYGVQPMDPVVLATVAAVLTGVALVAAAVPARRAQQIDPAVALAAE
jgi:putative ABC transport system permease protein